MQNQKVITYHGATAKELKHNIQFSIQTDTPDIVVTYGGCSNIRPRQNQEKLKEEKITKEIVNIASCCGD